uniref:LysM domain-containing protein n=1 Tax=Parascaris equorum TaxID=6256 RepID=A0A914RFC0_PAREQ
MSCVSTQMSEIKRLNRLWSNESLYLKPYINIPIYEDKPASSGTNSRTESPSLRAIEERTSTESRSAFSVVRRFGKALESTSYSADGFNHKFHSRATDKRLKKSPHNVCQRGVTPTKFISLYHITNAFTSSTHQCATTTFNNNQQFTSSRRCESPYPAKLMYVSGSHCYRSTKNL